MKKVQLLLNKATLGVKKHSPEILIGLGVAGVVTSTVMACKATTKLNDLLDDTRDEIDKIKEYSQNPDFAEKYSEEDAKKDLTIVYTQTGLKIVKLYGPAVTVGVLSLGCIIGSHTILRKRNVALASAYATVDRSFKEYRKRVADRFGEEVERQIKHNIKVHEFEETVVDEEGNETTVKKTIEMIDGNECSEYARYFDESSSHWDRDPEYNLVFLRSQQQYANDLLRSKGHIFLNEVYDMLGLPRSKAGQIVGWVYDTKNPNGDNYVDFGIYDITINGYRNDDVNDTISEERRDFINGYRQSVLLDFNVDGNIWDLI